MTPDAGGAGRRERARRRFDPADPSTPLPEPEAARRARRWRASTGLAFLGLPAALGLVAFVASGAEPASFLAPFLGPFAGYAYGHADCTMWSQARGASLVVIAFGPLALALAKLSRAHVRPLVALLPGAVWSLAWTALAAISILNASM